MEQIGLVWFNNYIKIILYINMKSKIKNISKIFNATFILYSITDTTLPEEKYLYIPKQDRRMMSMLYKLYDMKKHYGVYSSFESSIISISIETNTIPVVTAQEVCEKLNKI